MQGVLAKWGTSQRPFYECPDEIDVALVADAMVTMFRFLPEGESLPVFVQALQPEMSDAVKVSAIKACITLITEVRIPCSQLDENYIADTAAPGLAHSLAEVTA